MADVGRVSLRQVFSNSEYRSLGGNPVQKIALMKLLLAIAQAAATPADEQEWRALGGSGLAQRCLDYLGQWHERFYLFGERPFLQMPAISAAAVQSFGAVLPEVSTGNTTVLSQGQIQRSLDDADKALLLVCLMAFALSGKKTDNSVTLSVGYQGKRNDKGKPSSSKPGPAVAH
ncbi:type I-E CRISPR-associated protein Cse1/CasA, partial [Citrobacter sp. VF227]